MRLTFSIVTVDYDSVRVAGQGFVCVEGLLDDEIATVVHDECKDSQIK